MIMSAAGSWRSFSSKTDYVSYDDADAVTTPNQLEPHLR